MSRILVIDDLKQIRLVIQELLEVDGHDVDLAENGRTALKMTESNSYDLIITDLYMPEKDGLEVIKALKKSLKQVKIIAMSGGGVKKFADDMLKSAKIMGAAVALQKPLVMMSCAMPLKKFWRKNRGTR